MPRKSKGPGVNDRNDERELLKQIETQMPHFFKLLEGTSSINEDDADAVE